MSVPNNFKAEVEKTLQNRDPAHDFEHIIRVYRNAELIGKDEGADMDILLLSALMHDLVTYPKGSSKASKAADDSADLAEKMLHGTYPKEKIEKISYCIRTHSYSKKLIPATLEGRILQDADRLDALGAIGIARTFSVGGTESRTFYNPNDPLIRSDREPDDRRWTLDHFSAKLLKLKNSMHTRLGKKMAKERTLFMETFLAQLRKELNLTYRDRSK